MITTKPATWGKCRFCQEMARPQVCPGDGSMHSHGEVHRPFGERLPVCDRCMERVKAEWTMAPIIHSLQSNTFMPSNLLAADLLRRERLVGAMFAAFLDANYPECIKIATTLQVEATDGPR